MNEYLIIGRSQYDRAGGPTRYWTGVRWDTDLFNARGFNEADAERVALQLRALGMTAEVDRSREA